MQSKELTADELNTIAEAFSPKPKAEDFSIKIPTPPKPKIARPWHLLLPHPHHHITHTPTDHELFEKESARHRRLEIRKKFFPKD